jgi:hypothetical protein
MASLPKNVRPVGSRSIEITIGHWLNLRVAKARTAANMIIGQIKSGIDPRRRRIDAARLDGISIYTFS